VIRRDNPTGGIGVYDVLYMDRRQREKIVASGLARQDACELARAEAQRRGVGRMFLAGSELGRAADLVLIVESAQRPV
jgi:hypothetical protein